MAMTISVISFAFVLLWMVCITTQKTWRQNRCDKVAKRVDKRCEYECKSTSSKIPSTLKTPDCELKDVVRNVMIPWNSDTQNINVTTDSTVGSNKKVYVNFSDGNGNWAGEVGIHFYTPIKYSLGYCTDNYYNFPVAVPAAAHKTWTITYNTTERRLVLHCNEVEVLNAVLSNSVCKYATWSTKWENKPTHIKFPSHDSASESYCFASNPGAI